MAKPRAVTPVSVLGDPAPGSEYLKRVEQADEIRVSVGAGADQQTQPSPRPSAVASTQTAESKQIPAATSAGEAAISATPEDWFFCDSQVTSFRVPSRLLEALREIAAKDPKIGELIGAGILHVLELPEEERAKAVERFQDLAFQGKRRMRAAKAAKRGD